MTTRGVRSSMQLACTADFPRLSHPQRWFGLLEWKCSRVDMVGDSLGEAMGVGEGEGVEARGDADCFERVELIIFFCLKIPIFGVY